LENKGEADSSAMPQNDTADFQVDLSFAATFIEKELK
jgi:hypothetical protein